MNAANDIAEFLATRRAKITPEQAGLPSYGRRRVPGLRREEVASLAGVSADYYRRMERGQVSGASEPCSKRWRGRCSSTTPSASTCSIWCAPPVRPSPGGPSRRRRG
jgi:hypothetical protein